MSSSDPNKRADKCGNPFPDVCIPGLVRTGICYLTPALQSLGVTCGLPGILVIDVAANCSGDFVEIQDAEGTPVVGAFQVPCPVGNTIGVGSF